MDRSPNSQTTIDGWPRGLSLNQEYTETHTANALHHMPNIRAVATMVGAVESRRCICVYSTFRIITALGVSERRVCRILTHPAGQSSTMGQHLLTKRKT